MQKNLIPATIIGIGLIVGGYLAGGRYTLVHTASNAVARLDRLTGEVSMCIVGNGADSCGWTVRPRNDR